MALEEITEGFTPEQWARYAEYLAQEYLPKSAAMMVRIDSKLIRTDI